MNYLYYTLFLFYTKILRVNRFYPPVVNIAAVFAILEMFIIFSIVNTILYFTRETREIPYSAMIPFATFMGLYWFNERYYKEKEKGIVEKLSKLSVARKFFMILISFFFIALVVWFWMFDGLYQIVSIFYPQ